MNLSSPELTERAHREERWFYATPAPHPWSIPELGLASPHCTFTFLSFTLDIECNSSLMLTSKGEQEPNSVGKQKKCSTYRLSGDTHQQKTLDFLTDFAGNATGIYTFSISSLVFVWEGEILDKKIILIMVLEKPQFNNTISWKLFINQTLATGIKPYFPLLSILRWQFGSPLYPLAQKSHHILKSVFKRFWQQCRQEACFWRKGQ